MGVVWRAEDTLLRRDVAIKEIRLPPGLPPKEQESTRSRVLREARTAARLNHPSAVTIFDVVEHESRAFIVMELVDAPSLQEVVERDGPVDQARAASLALAVSGALEAAHAKGIVHRDVKPANVMLLQDTGAKLADFGIAISKDDTRLTSTGIVLGSPGYMAPEQAHGQTSTPESDLWGLGATMYYALEGRGPFHRPTPIATMGAIVSEDPPAPRRAGELAGVVLALLSKDPAERPRAPELRDILRDGGRMSSAAPFESSGALRESTGASTRPVEPTRSAASTRSGAAPARRPTTPGPTRPRSSAGEQHPRERSDVQPVARPARSTPPSARRAGRWALPLAALAVVAALAGAANLAFSGDDSGATRETSAEGRAGGTGKKASSGSKRPTSEPADPADDSKSDGSQDVVAAGTEDWTPYAIEDTGFTIAHPPDWEVVARDETRIDFRDPDTGGYLRLDWTDSPGPDPAAAWEDLSDSFGASHENYQEVRIDPVSFKGYDAAEWEFTYSESGADLHAVDLGFVTGDYGFALNFQTREADWQAHQDIFEAFKSSFQGA